MVEERLAACAREQRGSDIRTRDRLRRALRFASTFALEIDWEQLARAPSSCPLCPGGGRVGLVRGAVECDRVLRGLAVLCVPCRAVVPYAITARPMCSDAVDLAQRAAVCRRSGV